MAFNGNFMCTTFKKELMFGVHDFANGADTFKIALYTSSATLNASTTAYTTSNQVANPSVIVLDFGADKTSTTGDFTVVFPTADASNAIIRIA